MQQRTVRQERRQDITGEIYAPDGRALVPYEERPLERIPAPLVRINLPAARPDGAAPILEHERRIPVAQPTFTSHVGVPVLQALVSAVASAIVMGVLAWCLHWEARAVLFVSGLCFAAVWVQRMKWADGLLWQIETLTGYDVNRDGQLGAPHPPVLVNPSEARSDVARTVQDEHQDAEKAALVAFLATCFTTGTSESAHGIARGSGSVRDDYIRRRDTLIALGIGQWKNPARPSAGWRLTCSHERAAQLLERHILGGM